jgi:hypothetical protein
MNTQHSARTGRDYLCLGTNGIEKGREKKEKKKKNFPATCDRRN